jgi:hypothetical protein
VTVKTRVLATSVFRQLWHPPPLSTMSAQKRVLVLGALPAFAGAVCGLVASLLAKVLLATSALCMAGGLAAGREQLTWRSGLARGAGGGALFGACLLASYAPSGSPRTHALPPPTALHVLLATAAGGVLGTVGGATRSRAKRPPPSPTGSGVEEL